MEVLLGEHGEALIYGIVGTIMVLFICSICAGKWWHLIPDYKSKLSGNNKQFIDKNIGKFPIIQADEVIFTNYKDEKFNCKDFLTARDCNGNNITDNVKIYGNVNVFKKGLYRLRCVVVSDNNLYCTKYVNVIVE